MSQTVNADWRLRNAASAAFPRYSSFRLRTHDTAAVSQRIESASARMETKDPAEQRVWDFCTGIRKRIVGLDTQVPIFGGRTRTYVNLDNAATTPALTDVAEGILRFLEWQGSVHRGTGAKSLVSTNCYDRCRERVADFVGADLDRHAVIFTRGTTDSINKLARTIGSDGKPLVICTAMEHHSNLLPWRVNCRVEYVDVRPSDGSLDLDQLRKKLQHHAGSVRLVAVTGASNVTGLAPPIGRIARTAHEYGADIMVDAAQLIAHRRVRMGDADDEGRIDYLAFSAHKMYAPFGVGVLVGPRTAFDRGTPDRVGGGAVKLVTPDEILWADVPAREEAGTPNVVGAIALAKAIGVLQNIGIERIAEHDFLLRRHVVEELQAIPGVRIYGEPAPDDHGQVGVIAFEAESMDHSILAAALGYEWGIGVRHGCFCAHPYMLRLLRVSESDLRGYFAMASRDDRSSFPGLVRISLGVYNTLEEVTYAARAIRCLLKNGPSARYVIHPPTGEYVPKGAMDVMGPHLLL